jgi:hypothetical protein
MRVVHSSGLSGVRITAITFRLSDRRSNLLIFYNQNLGRRKYDPSEKSEKINLNRMKEQK